MGSLYYIRMSYNAPFSVAVLPLFSNGDVMLIRTFRHGIRGWGLEVPKGFGNAGESFLQAAERELYEETGLVSDNWTSIGEYYDCPSLNGSPLYCFIARDCRFSGQKQLDKEEPDIQNCIIHPGSYNLSDGHDYTDILTELFLLKYAGGETK